MAQQGGNCSLGVGNTEPGQAVNWASHPTQSLGTLETAPEPPASQEDLHQLVRDFRRASWPASSDGGDRGKIVDGENINGEGCGWFWSKLRFPWRLSWHHAHLQRKQTTFCFVYHDIWAPLLLHCTCLTIYLLMSTVGYTIPETLPL